MNKLPLALIGGLIVIGALYMYQSGEKKDAMMQTGAGEEQMMKDEGMNNDSMMKEEVADTDMMDTNDSGMDKDAMMDDSASGDTMTKPGTYQAYSPEKLAMAEEGKVVLFFKASWCPTCRALDADLKARAMSIPSGLTILEVNYDASTELKKKYGVTNQHTLVQVDADGNQINKWSGGLTLATVVQNLK